MTEEEIEKVMEEYDVSRLQAINLIKQRKKYEARNEGKKEIEVNIDTTALEDYVRRLQKTEQERDDYKTKLIMVAEREFARKKASLGCKDPEVSTVEELKAWAETHDKAYRDAMPEKFGGSGQALLSQATGKSGLEFESKEGMINFLRDSAKSGDKEAKAILDELFLKSSKGFLELDKGKTVYEDKSKVPLSEQLNRGFRKKVLKKRKLEEG